MPYYSFVLVCYNNWSMTKHAIDSLLESFDERYIGSGIELIIVNNGSKDETKGELENFKSSFKGYQEIIILNIEENMGYTVGLNRGLSIASGQIITVLNNDLIFPKGWFYGLDEALKNDRTLGVAAPYLSYASGVQNTGVRFNSNEEMQCFADKFAKEHKGTIIYTNRVISACLTMKREVLDLIGGYDFWFGLGHYDDDDWSLRVRVAGYKIGVIGESFVHHIGTVTFYQNFESANSAVIANRKKFMRKWNLKGSEYMEGLYIDREKSIESTVYNRQKHYISIRYVDNEPGNYNEAITKETNKCLFAADWTNLKSEWERKLQQFLSDNDDGEVYLWIPHQYFDKEEVMQKVKKAVVQFEIKGELIGTKLKIKFDNIKPEELITFIKSFDKLLAAENDYVNKFIVNLARQVNIQII